MRLKVLIVLMLAGLSFNAMSDCSVVISDEYGYSLIDETDETNDEIVIDITKALLKKGYLVVTEPGSYKLTVNFLEMYNEGSSGPASYGVQVLMRDSSDRIIAESTKEAGIVRMLVAGRSIPRAMTKKAIGTVVKQLPVCK